jgi:outer membrane cobalamin receptor
MLSPVARAPRLDDLYYPDNGNPPIQPERSHPVEAALQGATDALGVMLQNPVDPDNRVDLVRRAMTSGMRGTSARKSTLC